MMTHLVDSDWLADYLKGKTDALRFLPPLIAQGALATSIIVYGEIYEGLLDTVTPEVYLKALADILAGVPILGLDMQTA